MKRTQWKRKPTRLKKQSKQKISVIQRHLWEECRRIIKQRYGNVCYTCGATGLISSNWQIGHLFAKASLSAFLKYDLRVLRPQCFRCNIHFGGNGAIFIENMRRLEGHSYVDGIVADRLKTVKAYDWYEQLYQQYSKM